jgi:hypothetical protein
LVLVISILARREPELTVSSITSISSNLMPHLHAQAVALRVNPPLLSANPQAA